MVVYFKKGATTVYAVETDHKFSSEENEKLSWLFGGATPLCLLYTSDAADELDGVALGGGRVMS